MTCQNSLTGINDFYRGDTVPIALTITQNGTPVDITGSVITITFKKNKTDTTAVIQKNAVLTDPENGQALITLTPTDTDIDVDEYFYDIQWTDAGGNIRTLILTTVQIKQDINN